MSDQKGLPPKPESVEVIDIDIPPLELPGGATLSFTRQEIAIYASKHESMSTEVAQVRIAEAQFDAHARVAEARYRYGVPAEEQTRRSQQVTRQVVAIGLVLILVVIASIVGIVLRPEAAASIATIAGIAAVVFGGGAYSFVRKMGSDISAATKDDGERKDHDAK